MPTRVPIFSSQRERYRADTCQPVAEAAAVGSIGFGAVVHGNYPGRRLPASVLPELRSAGWWDVPCRQDWGLDWHRNEGLEFTYLASGRLAFAAGEQSYSLRPGDLTVTRPWQRHRVGEPHVAASRLIWLILDVGIRRPHQPWSWPAWLVLTPAERSRLTTLLRKNEHPVWQADHSIADAFNRIARLADESAGGFDRTRMVLAVNELLLSILEMLDGRKISLDHGLVSSERTVELFLAELPRHAGEPWTVESMARHCGLKRSRFSTHCRHLTNLSPAQYLARCRVEMADRLLREEPHRTITEIAMTCGFNSSQYFATAYRRLTGARPGEARRQPT